jgi:hypothetical protein
MCNTSYWSHVTPAGVVFLAGLVGCRYPPRVSDGLPRNTPMVMQGLLTFYLTILTSTLKVASCILR